MERRLFLFGLASCCVGCSGGCSYKQCSSAGQFNHTGPLFEAQAYTVRGQQATLAPARLGGASLETIPGLPGGTLVREDNALRCILRLFRGVPRSVQAASLSANSEIQSHVGLLVQDSDRTAINAAVSCQVSNGEIRSAAQDFLTDVRINPSLASQIMSAFEIRTIRSNPPNIGGI